MILPQNRTIFNEIDTFAPKCGPRPVQLIFESTSMQYLFDRLQATQKNCRIYFKQKWNSKMQSMRRPFLYVVFCGMAVLGTFREQVAMASEHPAAPEARILDDILPPANRHATWKPHLWRGIINLHFGVPRYFRECTWNNSLQDPTQGYEKGAWK